MGNLNFLHDVRFLSSHNRQNRSLLDALHRLVVLDLHSFIQNAHVFGQDRCRPVDLALEALQGFIWVQEDLVLVLPVLDGYLS